MSGTDTFIFIDTCTLLVSCWNENEDGLIVYDQNKDASFWQIEIPTLIHAGKLIVTKRNYDELVKLSHVRNDPNRPQLGERCEFVIQRLNPHIANGAISIVGDANDPFADAILLSAALKFRTQKNLLFITQDRALAEDLAAVSFFQSVRPRNGYELKVRRITREGRLSPWRFASSQREAKQAQPRKSERLQNAPSTKHVSEDSPQLEWWR